MCQYKLLKTNKKVKYIHKMYLQFRFRFDKVNLTAFRRKVFHGTRTQTKS